jgi:fluoroquinolone resistance protein
MKSVFNEGKKFENLRSQDSAFETGDYENCTFINCDFSNTDLSDINFLECEFRECNLSLAKLTKTSLREVKFIHCKLLGLHFEDCNNLVITVALDNCSLDLCSFNKLKLKKNHF